MLIERLIVYFWRSPIYTVHDEEVAVPYGPCHKVLRPCGCGRLGSRSALAGLERLLATCRDRLDLLTSMCAAYELANRLHRCAATGFLEVTSAKAFRSGDDGVQIEGGIQAHVSEHDFEDLAALFRIG